MKVLIVSDSHGSTESLHEIKERHKNADLMIHCGDSELPYESNEMAGFVKVRGNCDYDAEYPEETVKELNGIKIFVTHGHHHNVKMTLMPLFYRASEVGAQIACFGHSHIAVAEKQGNVIMINPGSILLPRMRTEKTYAMCEVTGENKIMVDFYTHDGVPIREMSRTFSIS